MLEYGDAVCRDSSTPLPGNDEGSRSTALLLGAGRSLELNWLTLERDSPFNGRAIGELAIRTHTGASVVGVVRDGTLHPNPGPDIPLCAGGPGCRYRQTRNSAMRAQETRSPPVMQCTAETQRAQRKPFNVRLQWTYHLLRPSLDIYPTLSPEHSKGGRVFNPPKDSRSVID